MKSGWTMKHMSVLGNHDEIYGEYDNEYFLSKAKAPLRVRMFEGLTASYPLYRESGKGLYWTIEHHAKKSLGAYEVRKGSKSSYFRHLSDAIDFYNNLED